MTEPIFHLRRVSYGHFTDLDMLADNEDKLWITNLSIAKVLDMTQEDFLNLANHVEAFAGKPVDPPFPLIQVLDGVPTPVDLYPFQVFMMYLNWQISQGNKQAAALAMTGFAQSFHSVVTAQCGH